MQGRQSRGRCAANGPCFVPPHIRLPTETPISKQRRCMRHQQVTNLIIINAKLRRFWCLSGKPPSMACSKSTCGAKKCGFPAER